MIPQQMIEDIRNRTDIVKVVSEYLSLRKRGKNYLGLCPFHAEKDASFTVSPEKQIFHCFGCNEGGNVFAFLMKIENIGFTEAVEELGNRAGIAVPRSEKSGALKSEKEKLYQIMLLAQKFFVSELKEGAREYLAKRKITDQTAGQFNLGFAPGGWDHLFKHLISRGVAPEAVERTGLILKREEKSGYYDRFRDRLIFPIEDPRGRTIAFGGRSLGDEEPKYLNSSDSAIYHKGETLYGLNLSKESIKRSRTAVMVEGYFDLITPFQAGITNLVATLGTALTAAQCKILARYCDNVILGFDADAAGGIAAERSIDLLRNQGLQVKIAKLSGGKDPDDIIRKHGKEGFEKCLSSSLPFLEFRIQRILAACDLKEIESKGKALRDIAALLSREKDPYTQKEYAGRAAAYLKTDKDSILNEIKRAQNYRAGVRDPLRKKTEKPSSKVEEAEKTLLALAAHDRGSMEMLKTSLAAEDFSLADAKPVAELIFATDIREENPSHFLLENLPEEKSRKFLSRVLLSEHLAPGSDRLKVMEDCIKVMHEVRQKSRIAALKADLLAAEKNGEAEKVSQLLSALKSEIA